MACRYDYAMTYILIESDVEVGLQRVSKPQILLLGIFLNTALASFENSHNKIKKEMRKSASLFVYT